MKREVISEKKPVTSTFGKDFFFGKIKFASTEQDCP